MAETTTKPTQASVDGFLAGLADEKKRQDSRALLALMSEVSDSQPKMWGENIIGFGDYHYVYESGRQGDTFIIGFSPRKEYLTLYLSCYLERYADQLTKLGKVKTGKGCLYLRRMDDVNVDVLREILQTAWSDRAAARPE